MKHLTTAFLTLWLCFSTQADDVDLYQGQSSGIRQNVMFLMDTSRSMSRWEYFDVGAYDPDKTYPVPINGFDPESYYYSTISDGDGSSETEAQILHKRFLHKDALECPSAKSVIESHGRVVGWKFKRWNPDAADWQYPLAAFTGPQGTLDTSYTWVCKSEEGAHPGGKYIDTRLLTSNGKYRDSIPWYSKAGYEIRWSDSVPNIFKGNWLNYQIFERGENENGGGSASNDDRMSRMTLVRAAATEAATVVNGFNLGLSRFDVNNDGGFVDLPIGKIEDIRGEFKSKLDSYFTFGATPLSESYYEIAQYYRGKSVDYGIDSMSRIQYPGRVVNRFGSGLISWLSSVLPINTYTESTPSAPASRTGDKYLSPITSSCQSQNSIVLFTDGMPQQDDGANAKIKALLNSTPDFSFPPGSGLSKNCGGHGGCAPELAYFLNNYDQSDLPGKQTIRTFVIGGFIQDTSNESNGSGENDDGSSNNDLDGIPLLKSIARHGGTTYMPGDNYQDIVNALTEVFGSASEAPATFVAPALATNTFNSLEHQDELYYAMFSTKNRADWNGNLKLYRLGSDGNIKDSLGKDAIGNDYLFKDSAVSYWTAKENPDGSLVTRGGAAENLTQNLNIFTHLTEVPGPLTTPISNSVAITALMGIGGLLTDDITKVINWANRYAGEAPGQTRKAMEDPLHSRPIVITYSSSKDEPTEAITNNSVVFTATNSGYLHAFKADKDNFKEYFSYVPKELLPNLAKYALDPPVRKDELYGLDGHINYWHKDINKDGIVNGSDTVTLYVGMRRGGNHYYALDVTDPEKPEYLWQINGGIGKFDRLGQTWSETTLVKVPFNGSNKVALLFGGGYDNLEDERITPPTNALGNAIYLVDAENGTLLWKASKSSSNLNNNEMTASFPSNIRPIDFNGDRITDYFFANDVAGKLWRFDINKDNKGASDFAEGGVIFDANTNSGDYKRFYNSPSISYFEDSSKQGFLTLSMGSGFRANPLSVGIDDFFYVVKDANITNKPASYTKVTPADLKKKEFNAYGKSYIDDIDTTHGWKFPLTDKVLAEALTTHGKIIFTGFKPNLISNPGQCNNDIGTTTAYEIQVLPLKPAPGLLCDSAGVCKPAPPEPDCAATNSCPPPPCKDTGTCPVVPPLVPPIAIETKCSKTNPAECSCEDSGTTILIGTSKHGETISRCGALQKTYWMKVPK